MRKFETLEEAREWGIKHSSGFPVRVAVGKRVYLLEVSDPAGNLRYQLLRQERMDRLWRLLGWLVLVAWVVAILWMLFL
jgi:hypothetical protein